MSKARLSEVDFVVKCGDKKQFKNEHIAKRRAAKSAEITGEDWSAYKCPVCGMFHIGHTPKAIRNAKERKRRQVQRRREERRQAEAKLAEQKAWSDSDSIGKTNNTVVGQSEVQSPQGSGQ